MAERIRLLPANKTAVQCDMVLLPVQRSIDTEGVSYRSMTGTSADAAPYWAEARQALGRADPILGNLIRAAEGSALRPRNDPFFSLSRSIVAQQISIHAAEAVWQKLIAHVGTMTPGAVARQTEDALRGCGLSRPKTRYLLSLAEHFTEGTLDQESWDQMDDDAVIARLVQVKGIGRWTAEMFLIFHLLRPDVLPVGDIGIQKAIAKHFNDGIRPSPDDMVSIAEPWRPWRSVASWYLWRSLDAVPVEY